MISGIQSSFYHYCRHNDAKPIDITIYKKENSDKDLILGSLPYDWIKDFPKTEITELTQKVDDIFHNYSQKTASLDKSEIEEENKNLKKDLSEALKRDDIKIEYIDSGLFKHSQKITVGDYAYSFSTFKKNSNNSSERVISQYHGGCSEPTKIHYIYKNYSRGRVAKPFISRPTDYNIVTDNGYILKKYIDKNDTSREKTPLETVVTNYYPIIHFDKKDDNCVNGVIIDVGGMVKNINLIENKETRKNVMYFAKSINDYNNLIQSETEKTHHNEIIKIMKEDYNAETLIYNKLIEDKDFYNRDIREMIKPLSNLEQKIFKKKLRKLRKIHKVKTQLQKEDKFDDCVKYLGTYRYTSWKNKSLMYELFGQKFN